LPTNEVRAHLTALYADADDPWNTHASEYEQSKFRRTAASLPRASYRCGLEIGCGAGALTAHLARCCDQLIAMDCTARAIAVARSRLFAANVVLVEGAVSETWPTQTPDLVILSEVLYFLTDEENAGLAARIATSCTADCDVVLVNWLGDTGGAIGGSAAAERLIEALEDTCDVIASQIFDGFRIDVLSKRPDLRPPRC
jgi:2-polyprenyl-3-methyl-5-hydroxy-6-metoxy-1,4-benzoquinol methylase